MLYFECVSPSSYQEMVTSQMDSCHRYQTEFTTARMGLLQRQGQPSVAPLLQPALSTCDAFCHVMMQQSPSVVNFPDCRPMDQISFS